MKYLVLVPLGLIVVLALVAVALWLTGHEVVAAFVFSLFISIGLLLLLLIGLTTGVWLADRMYQAGAMLVIKAQDINDRWDAQKTTAFANLARTIFSVSRPSQSSQQPLPPLLEAGTWMPEVDVVEGQMVEEVADGN